jgi:NADH:ubiquinone oxidoreductase subunit 6 (subunit J)
VGILIAGLLAVALILVFLRTAWPLSTGSLPQYTAAPIGTTFLTSLILVFEVTSLVLLVSLIGAIIIARRER